MEDIIKQAARDLRKNMTGSENLLWSHLRTGKTGKKFYRQKPIFLYKEDYGLDRYVIADFYSPIDKLVVELDGAIHDRKDIYLLDLEKEKLLYDRGFKVLRFRNEEVLNEIESVLRKIRE